MRKINEGLIRTNDKCVGCNRCIGVCSCPGATVATRAADGKNIIKVDGTRCITCGACIDACEHQAREYADDTDALIDALEKGENISVLIAPSFEAIYPQKYKEILGRLKTLGMNRVYSVAYGADITTWAYLNLIKGQGMSGCISTPCPVVVEYTEKYIPELIPKLMPVQSPMMCMAIYLKKYLKVTDKLVFLGPCIAKKNEIASSRGMNLISYSVTYDHLLKKLKTMDVKVSECRTDSSAGLGSAYPMAGGLKENIKWFLGQEAYVRQVEGEKRLYQYLNANKDRILRENPDYALIDALNCTDGCLCGTGVEDANASREDSLVRISHISEGRKSRTAGSAWSEPEDPDARFRELNDQFKELDPDDFRCIYEDRSAKCLWKIPTEEELDQIYGEMNKNTESERRINCSSCGYDTCREMAEAIYNGFNHKENCVHFIKDLLAGISADYPTVLLINEENQSVHLVKYSGGKRIRSWIDSGLESMTYDEAISDYIERYVDEKDRDRVQAEVNYASLHKNLRGENHFSTVFLRHSEMDKAEYIRMDFARAKGQKDIILSFRNVDASIRKEAESKAKLEKALNDAEQANRAKSTFLANMSHEIRTPINAILGMDTMILRESDQENVLDYAGKVKTAGNTLLSLINDILDFSKIESGKMEINCGEYRLDSVICDLVTMMRPKAEEKDLSLNVEIQDRLPVQLFGDEIRIKQIILNILNNAVKYTKEGFITLSAEYEQTGDREIELRIAVSDTGIGIREEDMEILFSPYARLEENKNKLIEGTGLGLSITRDLLEKMGSTLDVDSVYGKGSTFSFKLRQPMWGDDRISGDSLDMTDTGSGQEKKEAFHAPDARILVVDDVEMNITVLKALLKRSQIDPDSCLSGKEAIELAGKNSYDIIFLDAMMPGMSGEETLQEIRKNCPANADTPIVVLTANAVVGAREKYIEAGFSDYLSKPVDGEKLEDMIGQFLPEDKMIRISAEDADNGQTPMDEGSRQQLDAMGNIPGISTGNGIKAAGGVETYLSVCRNFCDTAANRISMIKEYFEGNDLEDYTIQVHALKSSARLVGADELSAKALEMETAGREKDSEKIKACTGPLLTQYEEVVKALGQAFEASAGKDDRKELSKKKFDRSLRDMLELLEAFDFVTAKELFAELEEYRMPEEVSGLYSEIRADMAEVNRDHIISLINDYFRK